jgi:membrane carboxypeptidase/penicillin-binding protein PbpC
MIAVKVLDRIGVDAMIEMAHRVGISTFEDRERFGLALTLGGGEVRLLELTAAYGAFANGGKRVTPTAILSIASSEAHKGPDAVRSTQYVTRYTFHVSRSSPQVLDPRVAYLITDILSDDQARMPAFGENSVLKLTRPAAAKTGTTTDWRDNWTIGYTPDLVVGVWVGNADNSPMRYVSGITGAGPIWHDFMEEVLKGRPVGNFQRPPGVVEVEVCESSGLLPTEHCPRRKREVFTAGTEPTEYDNTYQAFQIDAATGLLWEEGCQGPRVERVYRVLPPDAQDWGRKQGIPEPPTRPCTTVLAANPAASLPGPSARTGRTGDEGRRTKDEGSSFVIRYLSSEPLVVSHPHPNTTFALSPELPRSSQQIEVAARPGGSTPLRQVTLLVDGRPLATLVRPPYRVLWQLEEGTHEVKAIGLDAEGRRLESQPLQFTVVEAPGPG